jgi:hypothetical protein
MDLKPLIDKLADEGFGIFGTDLFIFQMPPGPRQAIMLRERLQGTPINHELPGYFRTIFQMVVRHPSYVDGMALAKQVSAALAVTQEGTVVGPQTFNYIRAQTEPVGFPVSEGNLIEFSVFFDVCYTV